MTFMSTSTGIHYVFVCGKNWKLSLAEITSYFNSRDFRFEVEEFSRSFFLIKTETALETKVINELGGILKIAEVTATLPAELVNEAFVKNLKQAKKEIQSLLPISDIAQKIPAAESGKSVFGVSVYWEDPAFRDPAGLIYRFLGSELKDGLKAQGKKTRFMGFPRERQNPQLTPVEVLKQGLVENCSEILFCIGKKEAAIGTTVAVHNPFEFQKRDLDKPVQRKIFGISPRVAKIMINLGHCVADKVFLDPFCGVGTFLQEALLINAKVIGVDVNRWCVEAAKRNLQWIEQEYLLSSTEYTVIQGDAKQLTTKIRDEADCIATEPDLGPALREVPTSAYAQRIIDNLNPLYEDFMSEVPQVLRGNGFLVIVTPYIRVRSGKPIILNIEKMADSAGLKIVRPFEEVAFVKGAEGFPLKDMSSFVDMDERHKIGRRITIYQKIA